MTLRLIFIAGGIFGLYGLFGVLLENLLKSVFCEDENVERFTFIMPLLFVATCFNVLYAYVLTKLNRVTTAELEVPALYSGVIALTYTLAMVTSFMALKWVSYPAQVIAKSAKPIPVLLMGILVAKRTFPVSKYFIVVFGVAMFMYKDNTGGKNHLEFGIGELLLASSLILDGISNALEEKVMSLYKPRSEYFMFIINKWAVLFLGLTIIITGEGLRCLSFVQRHPRALMHMYNICTCGAFGQIFIFMCITEFGTLTCSIITTTRKFFTVLGSVIIFGHTLNIVQWVGVACVFTGLFLDIYFGKSERVIENNREESN